MKVTIKLDQLGQGKVMLGKKDISKHVQYIDFTCAAGVPPQLNLSLMSEDFEIVSEMQESQINIDEIKVINPDIKK